VKKSYTGQALTAYFHGLEKNGSTKNGLAKNGSGKNGATKSVPAPAGELA
jgi:hypothetical protein